MLFGSSPGSASLKMMPRAPRRTPRTALSRSAFDIMRMTWERSLRLASSDSTSMPSITGIFRSSRRMSGSNFSTRRMASIPFEAGDHGQIGLRLEELPHPEPKEWMVVRHADFDGGFGWHRDPRPRLPRECYDYTKLARGVVNPSTPFLGLRRP